MNDNETQAWSREAFEARLRAMVWGSCSFGTGLEASKIWPAFLESFEWGGFRGI